MVTAGRKVLLVEDDDSMRGAIEQLLTEAGFACTSHVSGEALLARGVDADSACMITDLRLPGMSGLELVTALHERNISLPFVLITAHDAAGLRERAMGCGAAAYLAKPFRGTALLDAVRGAIERELPSR